MRRRGGTSYLAGAPFCNEYSCSASAPAIFIEGYDCIIDPSYANADENCGLSWTPPPDGERAYVRGAITDLNGKLLTSAHPAHVNEYLILWASGLGRFGKTDSMAILINNAPLCCGTVHQSIGPYSVPVVYAGESSISPGLFQINLQLPATLQCGDPNWGLPAWPSGTYSWDLNISVVAESAPDLGSIGGPELTEESNGVWVPVVVRPGDVSCSQ